MILKGSSNSAPCSSCPPGRCQRSCCTARRNPFQPTASLWDRVQPAHLPDKKPLVVRLVPFLRSRERKTCIPFPSEVQSYIAVSARSWICVSPSSPCVRTKDIQSKHLKLRISLWHRAGPSPGFDLFIPCSRCASSP